MIYLSLNVKSESNPNNIPFTIANAAFIMAKSLVFVLNDDSQACINRTPDDMNMLHPIKLIKISILLCNGAFIRIPIVKKNT